MMLHTVIHLLGAYPEWCYFWATHTGAELDLLVMDGTRRYGFEFKRTTVPQLTKSMRIALDDLKLERLDVIHAGRDTFPLAKNVRAIAAVRLLDDLEPLRGRRASRSRRPVIHDRPAAGAGRLAPRRATRSRSRSG